MNTSLRKVLSAFFLILSFYGYLNGAPVTPDQAVEQAIQFRNVEAPEIHRGVKKITAKAEVAYTSTINNKNCFYIINDIDGSGFTIVSADDRLPQIIGFSDNGAYDENRISPTMKWWLGEYSKEIYEFLKADPNIPAVSSRKARPQDKAAIAPMIKTKWDQTSPYNLMCPKDSRTGRTSVTGCVATALAQVMKYYSWPEHPHGTNDGYTFNNTTLDWANMLDVYTAGKYDTQQANAVALLMYQCGKGVNMMYSSYESGAYSFDVPVALTSYFDYDASMRLEWRQNYNQRDWNNIVYNELAANRPIYYSGYSGQGGHAFVCDGYLGNNYFHFNWGWGGYQDGYFLLNALNPMAGGTGSYAGGYNSDQVILTGVKKGANSNSKRQISMLCTGSFTWMGSNNFKVTQAQDNVDLIYNPLGYPIAVNPGIKIVDKNNTENVKYAMVSQRQTFSPGYGYSEYSIAVPAMADGVYEIWPAFYSEEAGWQTVGVPYTAQRYVTMTVKNGTATYSNEGPEKQLPAKLLATSIESVAPTYDVAGHAYRVTFVNVGEGDYDGEVGLGFYEKNAQFGKNLTMYSRAIVPSKSSADVDFYSNQALNPGDYTLIAFDDNEDIGEEKDVTFKKSDFATPGYNKLIVTTVSPNFGTADDLLGIMMTAKNESVYIVKTNLIIKFLDAVNLKEVTHLSTQSPVEFQANQSLTLNFQPQKVDLTAGDYYYVVTADDGTPLCLPQPLKIFGKEFENNGLTFMPTSNSPKEAMLVMSPTSDYSGSIRIPQSVGGYNVTAIKGDAFTFSDELTNIDIPGSIRKIEPATFYHAGLKRITVRNTTPILVEKDAFNPDDESSIILNSYNPNAYHNSEYWKNFKMSSWKIHSEAGCNVSGLSQDPATGMAYDPYFVNSFDPFKISVLPPSDKVVNARWIIDGKEETKNFWHEVSLPALYGSTGEVWLTLTIDDGVDSLEADNKFTVYSVTGVMLLKEATKAEIEKLPKGIYIVNGKKQIVK